MQKKKMSKCIFHSPYPIVNNGNSASAVRPNVMLNTLKLVYEVHEITGYGKERREKFRCLRERIDAGEKFEFIYSENSTMPNALTEKNHFPRYPLLESNIFRYCKNNGIKSLYFYRDIYWKFPIYNNSVPFLKRFIAKIFYRYDLKMLNRYIDILYLPSKKMNKYVGFSGTIKSLPPGGFVLNNEKNKNTSKELSVFYVGAVSGNCDMKKTITVFNSLKYAKLTLCCPKEDWEKWSESNKIRCNDNIKIIHKKGNEIEEYLRFADIGIIFNDPIGYREFAMPVKLFEYMTYGLPIISTKNSAAGDFIEKNGLGWGIEYKESALIDLLQRLIENKNELEKAKVRIENKIYEHTWKKRVEQIGKDANND